MASAPVAADEIVPALVNVPPFILMVNAPVDVIELLLVKLPLFRVAVKVPALDSVPLLTIEPPAIAFKDMLVFAATVTLVAIVSALAEVLLVIIVTGAPFRFKVLTKDGLTGLPVCWM